MPTTKVTCVLATALCLVFTSAASAQLSAAERSSALRRVRTFAECIERNHAQMDRLNRLISESERQRDGAREARLRQDAEQALDSLIGQASAVQQTARTCVAASTIPAMGGTTVQGPAADSHADSVAQSGGTVRVVEENTALASNIHVVRGEQVDGQGRLESSSIRNAVRRIAPRLSRCYSGYLNRGSISPQTLDLVFTFRGSGAARDVQIERTGFSDRTFNRCVRTAGQSLRSARGPSGGEATFSYTLRFGQPSPR